MSPASTALSTVQPTKREEKYQKPGQAMLHKALQLTMPTNIYGNPDISPMCTGLIFPVPVLTAGEVLPAKKGVGAGVGPMGHHCQMTPSMNKYYSNSLVCLNMKYHISDFKSILQACPCIHRDSIPECPPQQIQANVSYSLKARRTEPSSLKGPLSQNN